jgi:hypothetical protein
MSAAQMAAMSRQIKQIPDESVDALVRWFIPRSKTVGGKMRWFGRRVQLSSKVRRRRPTRASTSVLIVGTPAACWSIKSYGRRGNYDVTPRRARALRIPGVERPRETAHVSQAVKGDGRWDRLVREADRRLPDVCAELIDRRVF